MRPTLLLLLPLGAWCAAGGARAQGVRPLGEAITISSGDDRGCFEHDVFVQHVATWLDREELDERLQVVVDVGPPFSFVVQSQGEVTAKRRFNVLPRSCESRRSAVSLAVALAIDHTILETLGVPPPAPPPPAPPEAAPPPQPAPATSTPSTWAMTASAGPMFASGVLPDWAFGGRLSLEFRLGQRFAVRVGGFATTEHEAAVGDGVARVQLASSEAAACLQRVMSSTRLSGCLGVSAGAAGGEGKRGFVERRSARLPWVAGTAGLSVRLFADHVVGLRVGLIGVVLAVRPQLRVVGAGGNTAALRSFPVASGIFDVALEVDLF